MVTEQNFLNLIKNTYQKSIAYVKSSNKILKWFPLKEGTWQKVHYYHLWSVFYSPRQEKENKGIVLENKK